MEDCNVHAHSSLWMRPTRLDQYNMRMVYCTWASDTLKWPIIAINTYKVTPRRYDKISVYKIHKISLQRTGIKLTSNLLLLTQYLQPWTYWWKYKMSGITPRFLERGNPGHKNLIWPKNNVKLQEIFNKASVRPKLKVRCFVLFFLFISYKYHEFMPVQNVSIG